jgi:lysophospholipase L1-like esterase
MLEEDGFLDMERRMNAAIREVAAQEHVPLIDVARDMPRGRTYFADYSHFTSAGAAIMAAHLADGLRPLIDARLPHQN